MPNYKAHMPAALAEWLSEWDKLIDEVRVKPEHQERVMIMLAELKANVDHWMRFEHLEGRRQAEDLVAKQLSKSRRMREEKARKDPDTGLWHKKYFEEEYLPQFLGQVQKDKRASHDRRDEFAALWMVDVNHLKITNDTFGHSIGDELIRRIVYLLKRTVRSSRGETVCARLGGDEFAVLQTRLLGAREAGDAAARIMGDFSSDTHWLQVDKQLANVLKPSVSIGVAVLKTHSVRQCGVSPKDLSASWRGAADKWMYLCKTHKLDHICLAMYECVNGKLVEVPAEDERRLITRQNKTS